MSTAGRISKGASLTTANRVNKNTSLTTVQRLGIQQPQVIVAPGADCTKCEKCSDGFKAHLWRKVCASCFCPMEDHVGATTAAGPQDQTMPGRLPANMLKKRLEEARGAPTTRERIERLRRQCSNDFDQPIEKRSPISREASTTTVGADEEHAATVSGPAKESQASYVWAPKGLETCQEVDEFMEQLPEDVRPMDTQNAQQEWNRRQMHQMPLHDANILSVENPEPERLEFVQKRERAFCEGTVVSVAKQECAHCCGTIENQNLAVQSDMLPGKSWHPGCFVCKTCREFLVNLSHFMSNGELYCGRHHAELSRPRCGGCDELIFDQEYTLAGGNKWHTQHFCCFYCDKPLGTEEEEYVTHEGQVVCLPCYDDHLAGHCHVCKKRIGAGEHQLSCDNHQWHEECFQCDTCKVSLDADDFMMNEGKVFCRDCYSEKFGERCGKCKKVIKGRQISAMKKYFHLECFVCHTCMIELTGKKFFKRDESLFCGDCYDKEFCTPCAACNGYVRSQGLRCKSKVYHKDCFICIKCKVDLCSRPVIAMDNGVYCHECASTL